MVGVPRSKGCPLCVRRRVKCDEARPQCRNCVRYGAECPGYDRAFKFIDRQHKPRPPARRSAAAANAGPSSTSTTANKSESLTLVVRTTGRPEDGFSSSSSSTRPASPTLFAPRGDRGQYVCTMLDTAYRTMSQTQMILLSPWLQGIEEHLGAKATLDSALLSFILHIQGKYSNNASLIGESRNLYGRSLVILQDALNHRLEWRTTQTLCATLILSFFELFAGTQDSSSWMKHASGAGWLIQQRGPDSYNNAWEQSVLMSSRPIIIMNALFSLQDCFLAEPQWQGLLLNLVYPPTDCKLTRKRRALSDVYFAHLAQIPGIVRHMYPLREAIKHGVPVDTSVLAPLVAYVKQLRQEYMAWAEDMYRLIPRPTEIESKDPSSPFPTVFDYESPWYGAMYIGYWASMIILQATLLLYQENPQLQADNMLLARNILRSLETVGAGVMGPYRVGYGVHIAWELADENTQLWMRSLLSKYEKLYGGLQERSFESPGSSPSAPGPAVPTAGEAMPEGLSL